MIISRLDKTAPRKSKIVAAATTLVTSLLLNLNFRDTKLLLPCLRSWNLLSVAVRRSWQASSWSSSSSVSLRVAAWLELFHWSQVSLRTAEAEALDCWWPAIRRAESSTAWSEPGPGACLCRPPGPWPVTTGRCRPRSCKQSTRIKHRSKRPRSV